MKSCSQRTIQVSVIGIPSVYGQEDDGFACSQYENKGSVVKVSNALVSKAIRHTKSTKKRLMPPVTTQPVMDGNGDGSAIEALVNLPALDVNTYLSTNVGINM